MDCNKRGMGLDLLKNRRQFEIATSTRHTMADPLEMFGEVYGSAESRRRFRDHNYTCPFDSKIKDGICDKKMRNAEPKFRTGNCSIHAKENTHIICPHRFYEDNYRILREVRDFVWGDTPAHVHKELKLKGKGADFGFGSLDWLIIRSDGGSDFIGVEIQSDATNATGGIGRAIKDLMEGKPGSGYGVGANSSDTVKRFMTQFIFKGQLFDDWKMPYVAVIQKPLWDAMVGKFRIKHRTTTEYRGETFLFFIYDLEQDGSTYTLRRTTIESGRWIDFLFAYAVDTSLLLTRGDVDRLVETKMKGPPVLTF